MTSITFKSTDLKPFDYEPKELTLFQEVKDSVDTKTASVALGYLKDALILTAVGSGIAICIVGFQLAPVIVIVTAIAAAIFTHSFKSSLFTYDNSEKLKEYRSDAQKMFYGFSFLDSTKESVESGSAIRPLKKLCSTHRLSKIIKHRILSPDRFQHFLGMELKCLDFENAQKLCATVSDIVEKLEKKDSSYKEYRFKDDDILVQIFAEEIDDLNEDHSKKDALKLFFKKYDLEDLKALGIFEEKYIDELEAVQTSFRKAKTEFEKSVDEEDVTFYKKEYLPLKTLYLDFIETCQKLYDSHDDHQKKEQFQTELLDSLGRIYENSYLNYKIHQEKFVGFAKVILASENSDKAQKLLKTLHQSKKEILPIKLLKDVEKAVSKREDKLLVNSKLYEIQGVFDKVSEETEAPRAQLKTYYLDNLKSVNKRLSEYSKGIQSDNQEFLSKLHDQYMAAKDKMDKNTLKQRKIFIKKVEGFHADFETIVQNMTSSE